MMSTERAYPLRGRLGSNGARRFVLFTPISGHHQPGPVGPKGAIFGLTSKAYLHSIISSAMESTPSRHLDEFIISTRIYYRPRCLMPKSALHSRGLFQQYRSIADLPPSIP